VIRIVRADLSYLRDNWTGDVDEDTIRRDSVVLRRLLLDKGMLKRARSALRLKGEPRIVYFDLRNSLSAPDTSTVVYGSAGGYFIRGLMVGPVELSPSEPRPAKPHALTPVTRPLSKYLSDPGLCVAGVMVQRREIIKYVANKLGGAHYATRRDNQVEHAIQAAYTSPLVVLEHETNPAFLELRAIGQALASSQEVMEPFGLQPALSPVQ
jgi:hypothetical protein